MKEQKKRKKVPENVDTYTINGRLRAYAEQIGLNYRGFAMKTGSNENNMNQVLRGRTRVNFFMLIRLAYYCPDLDLRWLLTGIGDCSAQPDAPPAPEVQNESSVSSKSIDNNYQITNKNTNTENRKLEERKIKIDRLKRKYNVP